MQYISLAEMLSGKLLINYSFWHLSISTFHDVMEITNDHCLQWPAMHY
jgi:hypothetical protein